MIHHESAYRDRCCENACHRIPLRLTIVFSLVMLGWTSTTHGQELEPRAYMDTPVGMNFGGLPFAELKTRSLIDGRALAANDSPDFSRLIREGLPEALE